MPFPSHSINLQGSCTCKAILFKVCVPDLTLRPVQVSGPKNLLDLPICVSSLEQKPTSTIENQILLTPTAFVNISLPPRAESPHTFLPLQELPNAAKKDDKKVERKYHPAFSLLSSTSCRSLSFRALDTKRTRASCSRCGCQIFITSFSKPLLDIPLSTLDPKISKSWLVVEKAVLWDGEALQPIKAVSKQSEEVAFQYHDKAGIKMPVCGEICI